jgi:hypothetical protein
VELRAAELVLVVVETVEIVDDTDVVSEVTDEVETTEEVDVPDADVEDEMVSCFW